MLLPWSRAPTCAGLQHFLAVCLGPDTSVSSVSPSIKWECLHAQSCLTHCNPMDCSPTPPPPGSSVPGISQARILAWVAISSSRGYSPPRD